MDSKQLADARAMAALKGLMLTVDRQPDGTDRYVLTAIVKAHFFTTLPSLLRWLEEAGE
jgi:hypothetical protein